MQVSRDGGLTWKNVVDKVPGVPKETHVSRVEASPFDAGTAYVTFDGHRTDDHKPYVFVTKDFGETWTSIAANLPMGNANVITTDNRNRNLLFLGTEYAIYVSMDAGKSWKPLMQGMPTVRIDDLIIHPRDRDLIAGTHGRSIWILDDISPLEQMTDQTTTQDDAYLFDVRPATAWINDIQKQITVGGQKNFRGQNPDPGTAISYWLKGDAGNVRVDISRRHRPRRPHHRRRRRRAGLNRVRWNLQGDRRRHAARRRAAPARRSSRPPRRRRRSRRRRIRRRHRRPRASRAPDAKIVRRDDGAGAGGGTQRPRRRAGARAAPRPRRRRRAAVAAAAAAAASAARRFPPARIWSR